MRLSPTPSVHSASRRHSLTRVVALASSVFLGAGMLAVLPLLGTPAAGAATPTITTVNGIANNRGTGVTTLSVTPANVGDVLVLGVRPFDSAITVSSISGGGVASWSNLSQDTDSTDGLDLELWMGTVTATGASTITVTFSGSVAADIVELAAQEFSSGLGAGTTWTRDSHGAQNNGSSTTIGYPPLTPAGAAELYVGYAWAGTTPTSGSSGGTTWTTVPNTTVFLDNPSVSNPTTLTPTSPQAPAGDSASVGAFIIANVAAPTVTSISPTSGPTAGGTSVTITGTGLTGATAVDFGGTAATGVVVNSAISVTAISPAGSVGAVNVTVTTPGGTSATGAGDMFTYTAASSPDRDGSKSE